MVVQKIHQGQPIVTAGLPLEDAKAVMIMMHGRGGGTQSVLPLINHFDVDGFAYLVPSAADNTWYPNRFLAPRASNEPKLSSAIETITDLLDKIESAGIPSEKIIILGFSQGACLSLEIAARNPKRYGGIVALSGGLIGTDDELTGYSASLEDTPVFLGCSDVDIHIPVERVHQSRDILTELGAQVDERIYEGMGHTINSDEISAVAKMMQSLP